MKNREPNTFYLKTPYETKSFKVKPPDIPHCDIPSILLINSTCIENCTWSSEADTKNPVTQEKQDIIDSTLIAALSLFLETPEGQNAFGLFMDTGQQIVLGGKPVYTATCQGDFYNQHALHFIESSNLDSGNAVAVTESKYLGIRCIEKGNSYNDWHSKKGQFTSIYFNDILKLQKKCKYLYIRLIFRIHMKQYIEVQKVNGWDNKRYVAQMCYTIAHEFFIHGYRKSIPAMKAWNAGDFESYNKIIQRDEGDHGDYDHAAYIQQYQDEGLQLMESFKQSLKKLIEPALFTKITQHHDTKYNRLKNTKIPSRSTDDTEF